jgi:hypothetical protein
LSAWTPEFRTLPTPGCSHQSLIPESVSFVSSSPLNLRPLGSAVTTSNPLQFQTAVIISMKTVSCAALCHPPFFRCESEALVVRREMDPRPTQSHDAVPAAGLLCFTHWHSSLTQFDPDFLLIVRQTMQGAAKIANGKTKRFGSMSMDHGSVDACQC